MDPFFLDVIFDSVRQAASDPDHVLFYGLVKLVLGILCKSLTSEQRKTADAR
jgi:hypothetical protein